MLTPGRLLVALTALAALVSGCLAPTAIDPGLGAASNAGADWAERALGLVGAHNHSILEHHLGLSTPNFEVVGWDPLATEFHGGSSAGYFCGQAVDNGERRLSVVHSFSSEVGIVVADVTDPAHPVTLGELVLPNTHVYDVAVTPDAKYALLATSGRLLGIPVLGAAAPHAPEWASPDAPTFRDACTGDVREARVAEAAAAAARAAGEDDGAYPSGAVLVDLSDPANPVVADYHPFPYRGVHSIFATEMEGKNVVLASVLNGRHQASYFAFLTVEDSPLGTRLALQSVYDQAPLDADIPIGNAHMDGWIQERPDTGKWYAYLAHWNGGVVIVDVTNLNAPVEVGRWNDFEFGDDSQGFNNDRGQYHGTYPIPELWDGKHYTLIGQEITTRPSDTPSGVVSILDTTDPANPTRVAAWTLPVNVEWDDFLLFSTHYFRVIDRTMFVAMYHGGVWAVDLADPLAPRTVGVFVPANAAAAPEGKDARTGMFATNVLDLDPLPNGDLVVWEDASGVYVVRFDATQPAPAVEEWPIEP